MLKLIKEIIFDVTGKRGVTPETDFVKDLELNSFDIVSIVAAFEAHYSIKIPTRDLWKLRQVKDVMDYIQARGLD
jgi:acyl carrier protein